MKMIYNKIAPLAIATMLLVGSCTKDFEKINSNPNASTVADPVLVFSGAELNAMGGFFEDWRANLIYSSSFVQHLADLGFNGGKYVNRPDFTQAFFQASYTNYDGRTGATLPNLMVVLDLTKDKPEYKNLYNAARILRALYMHRITDLYGDVPYSEAGQGYTKAILQPKYDPQRDIYFDMLKELDEAGAALSNGIDSKWGSADLFYKGDMGKWKRLANSLMLRFGMRMSKADPTAAKLWVEKAINAGVMTSNDDIAKFITTKSGVNRLNDNPHGVILGFGTHQFFISKTLVDYMKPRQDPRLRAYAALTNMSDKVTDNSIANAKGMPNDKVNADIPVSDIPTYSVINPEVVGALDAPYIFQTYAEVKLLLAEASVRGWNPKGNGLAEAAINFNDGITASIQSISMYPNAPIITPAEIAAYTAANVLNISSPDAALEAIGNEYWVATFLNGYEAYANWRRTGYPKLTPVNSTLGATGGVIPRRLPYYAQEYASNAANIQTAISRQGPDDFLTRVWWDRP